MKFTTKKLGKHVDFKKKPVVEKLQGHKPKKLNEFFATSICGNDISSSCLYVAGISIFYAGVLAPIALLMVVFVLYLYKKVYAEVGTALPLNGGAYNCLLNTTSKSKASIAACMSLLAYVSTVVVSGITAVYYFVAVVPAAQDYVVPITIGLLFAFAVVTMMGIGESAIVSSAFFVFHITTLTVFIIFGITYMPSHLDILQANWGMMDRENLVRNLFFGFSAALLGISGFETSSNFIEEQKPGVFVKTLRNMWITISVFNPLIAIIVLGVIPVGAINTNNTNQVLTMSASNMGMDWLMYLIAFDAVLVLSGAVLTGYVGVVGLIRRMTLDRCLPQVLLKTGKRKTNYFIIMLFFFLCTSIILMTGGKILIIAAVYTISFLGVMSLFALGNLLLKARRGRLKRQYRAGTFTVIFALACTITGMLGNMMIDKESLKYFLIYFIPTFTVVMAMLMRIKVLKAILYMVHSICKRLNIQEHALTRLIIHQIRKIRQLKIIYFTRGDSRANLLEAALYVRKNELSKRIKFVHVYQDEATIPAKLKEDIKWIDEAFTDLAIDFEQVEGEFNREMIEKLSKKFGVAKNYMFIGTPGENSRYSIENLGEVRLII